MLKLLAVETSSQACSCALVCGDKHYARLEHAPRQHAGRILELVDEVLAEADVPLAKLDGLAFGRGPGSFTGLRIAASVVQGLGFAADLKVAPVSSLQALAQGIYREHGCTGVLTALDARMAEVYWGAFTLVGATMMPTGDEVVVPPGRVEGPADLDDYAAAGSGWDSYAAELSGALGYAPKQNFPDAQPHALDVAHIGLSVFRNGQAVCAEHAIPVYLRDRVTS